MNKVEEFVQAYKSLQRAKAFVAGLPAAGANYEFVVAVHQTSGQAVNVPNILEKAIGQVLTDRIEQLFTEALNVATSRVQALGVEAKAEHEELMNSITGGA